MKKKTKK